MSGKSKRSFRAFKTEEACVDKLGDAFLRAPLEQRAKTVACLLEVPPGWNLNPIQRDLLLTAGNLGLALPPEHQPTYEALKAKKVEHGKKISNSMKSRLAAKSQAEAVLAESEDPAPNTSAGLTSGTSAAPEKTIMEKFADFAVPEPRDPTGWRGPISRPALPSAPSSSEAPHPLRSLPSKPNS